LQTLGDGAARDQPNDGSASGAGDGKGNGTRRFLMRIANRIFTERPLSQVEVMAYLQGFGTEFTSNEAWTFLNVSSLYWCILRRWHHLRREAGMERPEGGGDEMVLLEEAGQRIAFLQAYPHRGKLLQDLSLYDYVSIVTLKRKGNSHAAWGEVEFDSAWPFSKMWVQTLRRPGKQAAVCLDGYLSMKFAEDDENYHRRYVAHEPVFRRSPFSKMRQG